MDSTVCLKPSGTGESRSIFFVLFVCLLFSCPLLCVLLGHLQIKIAPGVINISFFGRIKSGVCPLSDQNSSWSY